MKKKQGLQDLLACASKAFAETGWPAHAQDDTCGDTLALFVYRELSDTYDEKAPKHEATLVIRRAIADLEAVIEALNEEP